MYTISLHGANFDKNPGVGEMMVKCPWLLIEQIEGCGLFWGY